MYANSKIRGGVDTGYKSFRALAWLNTDNERCGFATKFQDSNSYIFDYVGTEWQYEQQAVNLTDYGITFEGTPSSGDDLVVNYTASTWTSFIKASTKADLFTLDASRIYPTVIKVA